jgi:O-antigen ligase
MIKAGLNKYKINNHDGFISKLAFLGLLLFVFLVPWGDSVLFSLPKFSGIFLFGVSLVVFFMKGVHTHYGIFHIAVLAYTSWLIISMVWSPNFSASVEIAITTFQLMLLPFILSLLIDNKNKLFWVYEGFVLGCMVATARLTVNYLHGATSAHHWNRYVIANLEIDTLSVILAFSIPLAAYLLTQSNHKLLKLVNLFAIPFIMFGIFLTGTRTGFIVAMLGIAYWLFTHRKSSATIKILIAVVSLASIIVILNFAPKYSVNRIFSAGKSIKSGTLNYRTVIWKGTISQWKKSPIVGCGLGGLGVVLSKEHINFDAAHNTYLHLLAENGIIGLLFYLLILLSLLYYILQASFEDKIFLLTLLMILMISQISLHQQLEKTTWIIFSLIVIHAYLAKLEKTTESFDVIPS